MIDGRPCGIPIFATLHEALAGCGSKPDFLIIGCAFPGGALSASLRTNVADAIRAGIGIVNGMHDFICKDPELGDLARSLNVPTLDVRQPNGKLHYWHGDVLSIPTPRIAVLGTDCAIGKRTTARFIQQTCNKHGINTEMVTTGQTGWMQGCNHGFILDATPNDFVSGELEHAIVQTARACNPDLILIEGQAAFRNPSGPCGAEFIVSGRARGVIIQHAPGRTYYEGYEELNLRIPPVEEDVELARLYGARTLAITLNGERLDDAALLKERDRLREKLDVPVILPMQEGVEELLPVIRIYIDEERRR